MLQLSSRKMGKENSLFGDTHKDLCFSKAPRKVGLRKLYLHLAYSDWCFTVTSCKDTFFFFLPMLSECKLCLVFGLASGPAG